MDGRSPSIRNCRKVGMVQERSPIFGFHVNKIQAYQEMYQILAISAPKNHHKLCRFISTTDWKVLLFMGPWPQGGIHGSSSSCGSMDNFTSHHIIWLWMSCFATKNQTSNRHFSSFDHPNKVQDSWNGEEVQLLGFMLTGYKPIKKCIKC